MKKFILIAALILPLTLSAQMSEPNRTGPPVQLGKIFGAKNQHNAHVSASTTAGTLVAARPTRRSVLIKNTDGAITVYIGAATVTSGNGMELKAGESVSVDWTGLIQVIAASGTPVVDYFETYD